MISSVLKTSWNLNFADFRDLGLILIEPATEVLYKKGVLKNFAIIRVKHLCGSLFFIKVAGLRSHAQGFSREFYKIFKNSFFIEHLWMTTSILQQLLTLYFATIHSWQLASSEKSLVGKKFIYISQGFYRSYLHTVFFIFFEKCLFTLNVGYTKSMLYCEQPTVLLAQRHLNTMPSALSTKSLKLKFLLKHFPRNTGFLSFDGLSHYLYLFEKDLA